MEEFYLIGIKFEGKLANVSCDPLTLEKAKKVKENWLNNDDFVILRCYEVEVE